MKNSWTSNLWFQYMKQIAAGTCGGLTRGRGMTEAQRSLWVLAMPFVADINNAMLKLSEADFHISGQHKDATASRISRDNKDIFSLSEYLEDRSPFTETTSLINIASGVTACLESNIDNACRN